jgi:hypothetical protein
LTVNEDYDLIDDTPDLDPVTFNARGVSISAVALEAWGRHPVALQARIRDALLYGGYWRTVTGGHLLEIGRHKVVLSSDGKRCDSYCRLPDLPAFINTNPIDALTEPEWDREAVTISPHAVRQFAGRHRVDEDEATDEIFHLLDDAAARGKRYRRETLIHTLSVDGFTLVLSPDGTTILSYRTVHAERTPSEVRNKVPSRFKHKHKHKPERSPEEVTALLAERDRTVSEVPPDRWLSTTQVADFFDPDRTRITASVVKHGHPNRYSILDDIREELRGAVANGRWEVADNGCHVLQHLQRRWTISPDGRGVLSCTPPWPLEGSLHSRAS